MDLVNLTARRGPIDMVPAGFPCQLISRARPRRGQIDTRFPVFLDLCRIINSCHTEQNGRPMVYLLENVCIDADVDKAVLDADKLGGALDLHRRSLARWPFSEVATFLDQHASPT